ncbi:glycosyltransferase [Altericista sp. CCNU0014]|uniref:glycosyltransferase n=1 Tax=Altericista sp. CCNU0014 TaxID=3082949 RepID=UPI00384FEC4C
MELFQSIWRKQIVRYLICGAITAAFNVVLLFSLVEILNLNTPLLRNVANISALEISLLFSFFVYRLWVWPATTWRIKEIIFYQIPLYHLSAGIAIFTRSFILFPLMDWLGIYYTINVLIGIVIGSVLNYLFSDRIVFRTRTGDIDSLVSRASTLIEDSVLALQTPAAKVLGVRERYRDRYWEKRDPIYQDRLLWRAQSFRHLTHLLPGQTILEIGCGKGFFTRQLLKVSRGENPITAVTFNLKPDGINYIPEPIELIVANEISGALENRQFDFVVAMDLLDRSNCASVLKTVYDLLKPGGQVIFYESNPWNVILKFRRLISQLFGNKDPRHLLNRSELYELISEVGFLKVFSVFNDFVYAPLNKHLIWLLRNLSILLENAPFIQTFAGSILIHAQKPPRAAERPIVSLCEHRPLHGAISVVVPCHNEEMNIESLINGLKTYFGEYLHEIIPVDDNSKDNTCGVLQRLAETDPLIKPFFRTPPNGVGRALRDGYSVATGRYILSMDCDFQHLLPEIRDLFDAAAEGYDIAIGSRFSRHSVILNYPFQKIVANRGFHMLARVLFWRNFRDLTNNLKLFRREILDNIQLTQPGFAVNAETGLKPLLMGYSVKEVPISWINRTPDMGVSSFRLVKVGGGYWQVLFKLWLEVVVGSNFHPKQTSTQKTVIRLK